MAKILGAEINILTHDVERLAAFYRRLGFRETFRLPKEGPPDHLEVSLDRFTIGFSSVEAAIRNHGLHPNLGGRPILVVLWTDDPDAWYDRLTAEGAPAVRPPQDFLKALRTAVVADPDGNLVHLVAKLASAPVEAAALGPREPALRPGAS